MWTVNEYGVLEWVDAEYTMGATAGAVTTWGYNTWGMIDSVEMSGEMPFGTWTYPVPKKKCIFDE